MSSNGAYSRYTAPGNGNANPYGGAQGQSYSQGGAGGYSYGDSAGGAGYGGAGYGGGYGGASYSAPQYRGAAPSSGGYTQVCGHEA